MAATLSASKLGLARIQLARKQKGWTIEDDQWLLAASKILHPEQDWQPGCYASGCSESTFKRFLAGKPIRTAVFKAFCQVLDLSWQEVVERLPIGETLKQLTDNPTLIGNWEQIVNSSITPSPRTKWRLELSTTFETVDEQRLRAIFELVMQLSGDPSLTLRKIDQGSLLLFFEGSLEGFDRIENLFRQGQLTELLGIPVISLRLESLSDLSPEENLQHLQQELEKLFNADWQPAERLLASSNARSRSDTSTLENSIRRAKEINLGTVVVLVIQMTPESEDEVGINIWIYPTRNAIYLPAGMQAMVLDEFGELVPDLQAQAGNTQDSIQLEFSVEPGEPFSVRIILGDFIVMEYF